LILRSKLEEKNKKLDLVLPPIIAKISPISNSYSFDFAFDKDMILSKETTAGLRS
jgi:hypothetical protein